jgi:cellulose synthase/poly-beta-1,6-N-acetylglucosamine synthase-like glycosyltransferase
VGVSEAPRVTVAVPVKDRREQMLRCLDALLALDHDSYEVLVLDNGSSDGTPEACRERARDASVPVRVETVPGSVGHVRNVAAELGRGEIVAFTDSDCMPTPGWLTAGVAPFADESRLGIVQGPTMPEPGAHQGAWAVTQELPEWTGRFECCNLIVRREALRESDGFDEEIFFGEDTAGGMAILRAGWRATFVRDALVHHDITHPGFRWWLKRGWMYGNFARVVKRYPELRRELLWLGCFLRHRDAKLLAALLSLPLARIDRRWLLLALPYAHFRVPRRLHPWALTVGIAQPVLFDLAGVISMIRGSIRHRTLLL